MAGSRKTPDTTLAIELEGKGLDPAALSPLVAAEIARDFIQLLVQLAEEKSIAGGVHGFDVRSGSLTVATRAETARGARLLEREFRSTMKNPKVDDDTLAAGRLRKSVETRERLRRTVSRLGPDLRIRTRAAGRTRSLAGLAPRLERAVPSEFVTVRVQLVGLRAAKDTTYMVFHSVLDGASYQLQVDGDHEASLVPLFKKELEIEADVRSPETGIYRGKLLAWEAIVDEGSDVGAWREWFKSTGWDGVDEGEIEKELGRDS